MLPTTERRLRKNFSSTINNMEIKLRWFNDQLNEQRRLNKTLKVEILMLQTKTKLYKMSVTILVSGIVLYYLL